MHSRCEIRRFLPNTILLPCSFVPPFQRLNPVFTENDHASFPLTVKIHQLYKKNGLFVKVKDWDRGLTNDELGSVQIPAKALIEGIGKPIEFKINPPHGKEKKDAVS